MSRRRAPRVETTRASLPTAPADVDTSTVGVRRRLHAPRTRQEVEERYVAAREAWTAAMRQAMSGKPADLANLAICQEAYEACLEERERWIAGGRVSVSVEPEDEERSVDAVVGQELAWRRVRAVAETTPARGLRGLMRRLRGR